MPAGRRSRTSRPAKRTPDGALVKTNVKIGVAFLLIMAGAFLISTTTRAQRNAAATVNASDLILMWPSAAKSAAQAMIRKYGQPTERTPSMLIWHDNGPWKHTIVFRDEVAHDFPTPHRDVLEQFVDYRVPASMFSSLASYDGSVIADRTKGELAVRSDSEAMNFLALNLANDIVTSKKTVAEARSYFTRAVASVSGRPDPYTTGPKFALARGGTADPDVATIHRSASARPAP